VMSNGVGNSVVTSVAAVTGGAAGSVSGGSGAGNGASNGAAAFFPDVEGLTPELKAPVAPATGGLAMGNAGLGSGALAPAAISSDLADFPAPGLAGTPESEQTAKDPMFKFKMLAAFATGVLIDRIISGLFQ